MPVGATDEELEDAKDPDKDEKNVSNLQFEHFYRPKWCLYCQAFKPPRAHHCREWNACVLKLDHYCPWVYNCVGYKNHKYFILFLFYSTICLIYLLACCITRFISTVSETVASPGKPLLNIPEAVFMMVQFVVTLPVTIGIASLFVYQIGCLKNNVTSIETFSYKRYTKIAKQNNVVFKWFYDFGVLHNVKQVLGTRLWEWFLPIMPEHIITGDGVTFNTRQLSMSDVKNDSDTFDHPRISKRKSTSITDEEERLI